VGQTIKSRTGCGTLFISVNKDEDGLCEVFANLGKAGGRPWQSEATCRVVSAALRCGVDPRVLIEQLKNIRCLSTMTRRKENKDINVLSCPDAIARAIEQAGERIVNLWKSLWLIDVRIVAILSEGKLGVMFAMNAALLSVDSTWWRRTRK